MAESVSQLITDTNSMKNSLEKEKSRFDETLRQKEKTIKVGLGLVIIMHHVSDFPDIILI